MTYDLLRSLGLTTVFGNPGSTEETFLQEFPDDFSYVLALQEASAIAMADAFAQLARRHAGHQLLGGRAADLEPVVGVNPVSADEHRVAPDGVHPVPCRGVIHDAKPGRTRG